MERRHADLNKAMQLLRDKKAWPLHLPGPVAFAYNTLKSVVTNVCPAQVEYGKTPRGPVELKLTPMEDEPTADQRRMVTENQLASHISALQAAQRIYWFVAGVFQQRNRKLAVERKNREAKRTELPKLKVGDRVKAYRPQKVKGSAEGTFTVERTLSDYGHYASRVYNKA